MNKKIKKTTTNICRYNPESVVITPSVKVVSLRAENRYSWSTSKPIIIDNGNYQVQNKIIKLRFHGTK